MSKRQQLKESDQNYIEVEDRDPQFTQFGPKTVDFKRYLNQDSISRIGKIFSPEFMLNIMVGKHVV